MMHDVIVGETLAEVRDFKKRLYPLYRNWLEVSARSADRLRGMDGVDCYIILPGFEALPYWRQEGVLYCLYGPLLRDSRGRVTPLSEADFRLFAGRS